MPHVVVGVDGSTASLEAARWAAVEAAQRRIPLRVAVVTPDRPGGAPPAAAGKVPPAVAAALLRLPGAADAAVVTAAGDPGGALAAACGAADLLVLGTRGAGGFPGLRLGSTALRAAGTAACHVVLVPRTVAGADTPAPEVAVGTDAREPDHAVLDAAFEIAGRREARLRAVGAWGLPPAYADGPLTPTEEDRGAWEDEVVLLLTDALRRHRERRPAVAAVPDVRLFRPADALVRASARAALLVVGRGSGPGLSGPAHALAHHARCPVLLVPPSR